MDHRGNEPFSPGMLNSLRLKLTPSQRTLQRRALDLSREVLGPAAEEVDREGRFPKRELAAIREAGLLALPVAREHGGSEEGLVGCALATEALAYGCGSTGMCFHMHTSALALIAELVEGEQVEILRDICGNGLLCTYATSEFGSGGRWWHMDEFATRTDTGFLIDAKKSFVTSAGHATYYVVPLRSSRHSPGGELTLFLIDGRQNEVVLLSEWDGMGLRGNSSSPVHFKGCSIADKFRLRDSGHGFPLLLVYGLPSFQIGLSAVYLGIAQAAFDAAVEHVLRRVHSDTNLPLSSMDHVQCTVGEMRVDLDRSRALVYSAAQAVDDVQAEGTDPIDLADDNEFMMLVAETKVAACHVAASVSRRALQICGGRGFKRGAIVERCFRDAPAGSVMGPSDDVLKIMIGRRVMGLPYAWEE
jgi:alkylation response protein AidB-like acyl-CoA dehydrogenase